MVRLILLAAWLVLGACSNGTDRPQPGPATASQPADDLPDVVATIGGEKITAEEVRTRLGANLSQLDMRYRRARYQLLDNTVQEIVRERTLLAEARKQGKSIDELIDAELGPAGGTPTDSEVAAWYQANRARIGNRTLEEIRPQLTDFLRTQRRSEAMAQLQARLNDEKKVVVSLPPFRVDLDNDDSPALGSPNAPVTLAEFADFQCPYCAQFSPTLKQLQKNYGDKLRIVYRHFPIPSLHPQAFKAAEASMCAHDQGRFWELHDLLYAEKDRLSVSELKEKAARIGLDRQKFDRCLDSGKYVEKVQNDYAEGEAIGVAGTPALFVNGVPVEGGAVAYDVVAAAIDRELKRAR